MKNYIRIIQLLILGSIVFTGCKKDIPMVTMGEGDAPVLTVSASSLVLDAGMAADTVQTISWTKSEYGFRSAISYTLEIAKAGNDFAGAREISMGSNLNLKYTAADLNQLALILGLAPNSSGQLDIRVKSVIAESVAPLYSETVTVGITPYLVIINYPSLWVPGDYQGWDPASAPKISSKGANGIYEGYVNIPGGSLKFKFTSEPDWNHINYGWASSTVNGDNVSGTFSTSGGDLFVPVAGYYLLKANTSTSTWSGTKINSWSMIGDFNGWGGDANMTYDATTKLWAGTLTAAAAGGFKFRANNDWPINLGDTGADLNLDYDGTDIAIGAGTFTVTLDLSVPGNYTYTIQ